jgi:hypothetical protein
MIPSPAFLRGALGIERLGLGGGLHYGAAPRNVDGEVENPGSEMPFEDSD